MKALKSFIKGIFKSSAQRQREWEEKYLASSSSLEELERRQKFLQNKGPMYYV